MIQSPNTAKNHNPGARTPAFTVCVLLYGDYPELAMRCLSKLRLLTMSGTIALRIGTNSISQRTADAVRLLGLNNCVFSHSKENIIKYPMMKRLFCSSEPKIGDSFGVATPFVMWFDDDSYISADDPYEWLSLVEQEMEAADMIGSVYSIRLKGNQSLWVKRQPWYNGVPVTHLQRVSYCTGGWWTIRTDVPQKFQWPISELVHRGGDVMLGELCRQQGLRLVHFREGIAINADADGLESKSPRRGFDSAPVGFN